MRLSHFVYQRNHRLLTEMSASADHLPFLRLFHSVKLFVIKARHRNVTPVHERSHPCY